MRGFTKAWRSPDGGRKVTVNEGEGPFNFTLFMSRRFRLEFFYIFLSVWGRQLRWHWKASK